MPKPRALQTGDTIAYVSPASAVEADALGPMTELLEGAGYKTRLMPHALDRTDHLAGRDEDRAADFQAAFDDPEINAVMCTRGGYGSCRIVSLLDLDRIAASGKMFLGFSDVTTLHLALNRRGLPSVHAPMALTLSSLREGWVYESLLAALRGDDPVMPEAPEGTTLVQGVAEGVVTGGCLSLLTYSIGTPNPLQTEGKILVIEDVDELPHRVDAMLTHLLNAGLLQKAAGIVIGEMTRTDDRKDEGIGGRPWRAIVQERVGPLGVPTIIDYPFGHCRQMLSLPLGIAARLDATAGTLTYTERLCA